MVDLILKLARPPATKFYRPQKIDKKPRLQTVLAIRLSCDLMMIKMMNMAFDLVKSIVKIQSYHVTTTV